MTNKEKLLFCRQRCTKKLHWNDKKRKFCQEKQACKEFRAYCKSGLNNIQLSVILAQICTLIIELEMVSEDYGYYYDLLDIKKLPKIEDAGIRRCYIRKLWEKINVIMEQVNKEMKI